MKKIEKTQVRIALHHVKEVLGYEEEKISIVENLRKENPTLDTDFRRAVEADNRIRIEHLKTAVDALTKLL